jgi:K+-transporting ATPase KdpF subunit
LIEADGAWSRGGHYIHRWHGTPFRRFPRLCAGMRAAEIAKVLNMLGQILLIVICVCLFGYLLAALLWPEKF